MFSIMIIEDDISVRQELELLLSNSGYAVVAMQEFTDIPNQVVQANPSLILLDIGLPDTDGYTLCASIRRISSVPIIFVTSRDSAMDELKALSFGGDDFITKPYNIPILLARIAAVLRRNETDSAQTMQVGDVCLDLSKSVLDFAGGSVELTKNEYKIVYYLMKNSGNIMSRMDIIEYLWDNQVYIDDNTLSVNMTRLRNKLKDIGLQDWIQTKRGMGYII